MVALERDLFVGDLVRDCRRLLLHLLHRLAALRIHLMLLLRATAAAAVGRASP